MLPQNKKFVLGILLILFFFNVLAWLTVYDLSRSRFLEVTFFDIGQGDAIFIETPSGHQVLIDGGPDSTVLEKLGKEMPFWDRTIDLVILTHPEHDHYGGLIEVLKRYKVENILWTGIIRDTAEYKEWQKLIKNEKAKIKIAQGGQNLKTGSTVLHILYPFEDLEGKEVKNTNNTSVIGRLVFGQRSFLFTGDAYKSTERKLIKNNTKLNSDVLKVGHHGSKTSTAEEFVEQVSPEIAVISVGKNNRYGHPCPETLETLAKYSTIVLRTDLKGDIKIFSDGENLEIKTKL